MLGSPFLHDIFSQEQVLFALINENIAEILSKIRYDVSEGQLAERLTRIKAALIQGALGH